MARIETMIGRNVFDTGTIIEKYYPLKEIPKRLLKKKDVKDAIDYHIENDTIKGIRTVTLKYDNGTNNEVVYIV